MKKQNKRNQFTYMALALLLILSMLGNTLILPAVAQETVAPVDEPASSDTPTAGEADTDSATPTLPEPILLTAADIPEFISAAALEERGAVERMRSEETNMSSVIFRNADGTRTMYMYGLPVKYTAMDGTVRDKSTNLVSVPIASVLLSNQPVAQTVAQMSTTQRAALQEELGILDAERAATTLHMLSTALTARQRSLSDMAYTTLDNDVYALFPTNLAQGMTLVFGEHSVRMTPAGTGLTVTAGGNVTKTTTASLSDSDVAERLLYPNVFGLGTAVQYTPTLTGVKEEILLARNVGKNSFAFLLETGGLVLTEQNGQFVLIDPETEQQVGKLGEIIVFDSAGQIVRGQLTAQTILAGQKYGITVSVDQEFLASATYPVAIDPDMSVHPVWEDGETVMIEDVSIYDDINAQGYTFIEWHQIGSVISTQYQGQAAFRFPFLYNLPATHYLYHLTSDHIASFTLHLKTTSNTTPNNVLKVSPYTCDWPNTFKIFGAEYYDKYTVTENDVTMYFVQSNQGFSIDLTELAKQWKDMQDGILDDSAYSAETGVLLYSGYNEEKIWIESVEYSEDVYVVMDYAGDYGPTPTSAGNVYMNNKYSRTFLSADIEEEELWVEGGLICDIGTAITWNIEYEGDGKYSLHPNGDQEVYLDMFGEFTYTKSHRTMWTRLDSTVYGGTVWTCDDGYVLCVDHSGRANVLHPDSVSIEQMTWRVIEPASYNERELTSISAGQILVDKGQTDVVNRADFSVSPINAFWSSAQDFEISIQNGSAYIAYNEASGVVTATEHGVAKMRIRHIPTGVEMDLEVIVPKYELTVVHYYDEGFVTRYGGIGNALEMIEKCSDRVSEALAKVFLLKVINIINIYEGEYYSLADEEGAALDCDTNCVTRDELKVGFVEDKGPGSNVVVNVLWTGHRLEGNPTSASWYKQETHVIIITPYKAYPYDNETGSYGEYPPHKKLNINSRTLLHEISHQFFALDHFCPDRPDCPDCPDCSDCSDCPNNTCENAERCNNSNHNPDVDSRRDGWCIMDNDGKNDVPKWTDITARNIDEIFCEQCKAEILAHLEEHH